MPRKLETISTLLLRFIPAFLIIALPFFFLSINRDPFNQNKQYLIFAIASLSLVAWSIRNLARKHIHLTLSPSLTVAFLFSAILVASSLVVSHNAHLSLLGSTATFIALFIIYTTVSSSQKNLKIINTSLVAFLISGTISSLFTIFQYFGITKSLSTSTLIQSPYFHPAGGPYPALLWSIPILIGSIVYLFKSSQATSKILLLVTSTIISTSIVINILHLIPGSNKPVFGILPFNAGWSIGMDVLKTPRTALLGTGPDTFLTAFTRFRPGFLNSHKLFWNIRFSESSSLFLTLLTTSGIISALAFISIFALPIIRNKKQNDPVYQTLKFSLLSSIAIFLFLPAGTISIAQGFIILILLTIYLKIHSSKSVRDFFINLSSSAPEEHAYQNLSDSNAKVNSGIFPWAISFVLVALLVPFWFFASRSYLASVASQQAENLIATNPLGAYQQQLHAASLASENPAYHTALSQTYLSVVQSYYTKENLTDDDKVKLVEFAQRAIDSGKMAVRADYQNAIVWENLSSIYKSLIPTASGSANLALSHLSQAITQDPTNPRLRLQIANLLFNLGSLDEAIRATEQAIELKPNWDIPYFNLATIYKSKKEYVKALQLMRTGIQFTSQDSTNIENLREEIKTLEEMTKSQTINLPQESTSSATIAN